MKFQQLEPDRWCKMFVFLLPHRQSRLKKKTIQGGNAIFSFVQVNEAAGIFFILRGKREKVIQE